MRDNGRLSGQFQLRGLRRVFEAAFFHISVGFGLRCKHNPDDVQRRCALARHRKPGDAQADFVAWLQDAVFGLPSLPLILGSKSKKYLLNDEPVRADGKAMFGFLQVQVNGKTIFIDTNRSAYDCVKVSFMLLDTVNAPPDSVRVQLRPIA